MSQLHDRPRQRPRQRGDGLQRRGHTPRRRRLRRLAVCACRRAHLRSEHQEIHSPRDEIHRPRRHRQESQGRHPGRTRQVRRQDPVRRGQQPGIPQGRLRHHGLHETRPRRGGCRKRTGEGTHDPSLSPYDAQQLPRDFHGYPECRDDQVRRELHACDPHQLHERYREPLRTRWR